VTGSRANGKHDLACYLAPVTGAAPRIAISLGDPAGIGPEIVVAAVAAAPEELRRRIAIFGDRAPLERAARVMGVSLPAIDLREAGFDASPGEPDERSGAAQVAYLEAAVAAAQRGEVGAIATAPISKTWARRAGFDFPGHTEMLAARFGGCEVAMMFAGPRLKVVLATVHVPLREVATVLTRDRIERVTRMFTESLVRDFGIAAPRVGVVGLNPHAGEGGMLGAEDDAIIAPVCAALGVGGPLVPDAAFRDAVGGRWDGLVAMYHDQALIPVKLVDFEDAVNVTLGLPIVRTSPDHGTAYDIAGRGVARWSSFAAALRLADEMSRRRASV
jgi:4-hydroxythreonine-4-phosphate dehydrogenase